MIKCLTIERRTYVALFYIYYVNLRSAVFENLKMAQLVLLNIFRCLSKPKPKVLYTILKRPELELTADQVNTIHNVTRRRQH